MLNIYIYIYIYNFCTFLKNSSIFFKNSEHPEQQQHNTFIFTATQHIYFQRFKNHMRQWERNTSYAAAVYWWWTGGGSLACVHQCVPLLVDDGHGFVVDRRPRIGSSHIACRVLHSSWRWIYRLLPLSLCKVKMIFGLRI